MPLLLDTPRSSGAASPGDSTMVEIALLNNLGDAGLEGGERQFVDILSAAAGPDPVRLRFFSLPGIARGAKARARIDAHYTDFADLMQSRVDGLIVTGCEPCAESLAREPIWRALTAVIDWAEHNTCSTIFSCLAAHAAVLHLDGVDRQRLARKCTGLFTMERVGAHPLLAGIRAPMLVPHSRWNGLDADALTAAGYDLLTQSPEVGVDIFVKQWRSLFVYLQGHPEYDEGALRGEYRRDVLRFLTGSSATYPDIPEHYFPDQLATDLRAFATEARRDRATAMPFPLKTRGARARRWRRPFAIGLFRNWLRHLQTGKRDHAA